MADLKKKFTDMKVVELRQELDKLGLDKNGVKMVLVDRLMKHFEDQAKTENSTTNDMENSSFDPTDEDTEDNQDEGAEVFVEEVLDQNDDHDAGSYIGVYGEEDEEDHETEDSFINDTEDSVMINTEDSVVIENDEFEETGEEEETVVPNDDEEADNLDTEILSDAGADTQVIDDGNDDDKEPEADSEALDISVDESEQLAIDDDNKALVIGEKSETIDDGPAITDQSEDQGSADGDDNMDQSINTSSVNIEADQDSKTVEGENEETSKNKEAERHIILVTGLSSETSANDLKTHFRKYGKIGRIKIMTNTRVPGAQRFAHISVMSLDDLNSLVGKLNGAQLKGKNIRVSKAPGGPISKSYEIAVAAAQAEAEDENSPDKQDSNASNNEAEQPEETVEQEDVSKVEPEDVQVIQDTSTQKEGDQKDQEPEKKSESPEKKKEEKKEPQKESPEGKKKSPEKPARAERMPHKARKPPHAPERPRGGGGRDIRSPRNFRRERDAGEWRRHGPVPRMEITRVHRDRVPINRPHPHAGPHHPPIVGGRRRSPHAPTLTFEQIREIRDEQRRREIERRKREEERERVAEMERQKRLEYQNYMEFKTLEREREKLRWEKERIEKEKQELIRMERERQKTEREKIEREKEELRRAKMNIEHHSHRSIPLKRPYEEEKERRRDSVERKKPYALESERRARPEVKTEAERKMERERYERERLHGAHAASRSPHTDGMRESRRDVWASEERERASRKEGGRSGERSHRRESESGKSSERRAREAPSRAAATPSDLVPRYALDSAHSSARGVATSSKRPTDRYEDSRATGRDDQWMQRSSYLPGSSLSLPMGSSTSTSRDSWPMNDRKIENWETARLPARTDQWISGAGATVGTSGRSSLPVIAPPPPMYSHQTAPLPLPGSGLGLGSYSSERYDSYKGGFHHLRRF